ncbi:MAG: 4-hydroxy-tetrahydrodipicolinate reductase [Chloroflexi bacterium]|nr:4-hydroxy-tetrahydrodipicolinate reductase [Chloroflexota bacterium]
MTKRICLAGATGWAGSALAQGILAAPDLELVAAVSRSQAGKTLGEVLGDDAVVTPIFGSTAEALDTAPDIFMDYTKPDAAKKNVLLALEKGAHVVIGTSGLTAEDFEEIGKAANKAQRGVLAVGNFALTVVLLQKFAEIAAKYIPHWEIIDYASSTKIDAPSGTVRELANRLGQVGESELDVQLEDMVGPRESRGVRMEGTQVHSVRLPGYVIALEAIFGMEDQKLILRHEAGSSAQPYVDGALLAIGKVDSLVGLHRGLDSVMDL